VHFKQRTGIGFARTQTSCVRRDLRVSCGGGETQPSDKSKGTGEVEGHDEPWKT